MADTDKDKDAELQKRNADYQNALSRLQNRKPCFETSNSKVFTNLHVAAAQKAAEVLGINPSDPNINQFIINTGMSEDGRYINDEMGYDDKNVGGVKPNERDKKRFNIGNNRYEIGIVLQFTDYVAPNNKDLQDKKNQLKEILAYNESKGTLKKYRDLIFSGLQEYCKWFWGDSYSISPSDVTEFIPDFDGGRIQIQGGEIKSMDEAKMVEYLMNRSNDEHDTTKRIGNNLKPRLGYKIGYEITYK